MISEEFKEMWGATEAAQTENNAFENLPAGKYITRLYDVRFDEEYTKDGRTIPPCLHYVFEVTEGKFKGRRAYKNDYLKNAKNIQFAKKDICTLGCVCPKDPWDLTLAVGKAINKGVAISVVHSQGSEGKTFVNIYIDRLLETITPPNQPQAPVSFKTELDSEIPF